IIYLFDFIKNFFYFYRNRKEFIEFIKKKNKNDIYCNNYFLLIFIFIKNIIDYISDEYEIVFYILLSFQLFLCAFFVHLHTIFRFISYNPLVYWLLSKFYKRNKNIRHKIVIVMYFTYTIVYTVLFSSYYPPA
ncbi:hypothetical protein SLOPH_1858, partial [Spraguea lophii 42_110]